MCQQNLFSHINPTSQRMLDREPLLLEALRAICETRINREGQYKVGAAACR